MSERDGRLDTDSGNSQGNQVARHVTTLVGMLQILTASVGQGPKYPHFGPLAQDATELRALVDSNAGSDVLYTQALRAITRAEDAIRTQTSEIVMATDQRRPDTTTVRRGFWLRPKRRRTAPTPDHTHVASEVDMVVRSSGALLSTLQEMRESIIDDGQLQQTAAAQEAEASQTPSGAHHAHRW
jgi:hypothetical protein